MSEYRAPVSGAWNYRVVVREFEDGKDPEYAIHEAHYDDDGVMFVPQDPVGMMSETLEGLAEELKWNREGPRRASAPLQGLPSARERAR